MKKYLALLTAFILAAGCFPTGTPGSAPEPRSGGRLQIVTTIFPLYDWVTDILGDNPGEAGVAMLLDDGVDPHSFQPTVDDILKISTCDLFIYVGGESDVWVEDVLKEAVNPDMEVMNLMEILGDSAREEEAAEGMQAEEHEHSAEEEHESEEVEYDEHIWLSLRNASVLVSEISGKLQRLDEENAGIYRDNAASYAEKLNALDAEYQEAVSDASVTTLVFGDRFPFRYLTEDYGLSYYAAFDGCSAETEASFETISFLAQKIDELALRHIITIEGSNHRIAETVVQSTQAKDQQILVMDSMQGITDRDRKEGASYLAIMEENLEVLKEALQLPRSCIAAVGSRDA